MLIKADQSCQDRLSAAGAGIVTTEMVVFEWLGRAGTNRIQGTAEKNQIGRRPQSIVAPCRSPAEFFSAHRQA